jgi:hypothetical protein
MFKVFSPAYPNYRWSEVFARNRPMHLGDTSMVRVTTRRYCTLVRIVVSSVDGSTHRGSRQAPLEEP